MKSIIKNTIYKLNSQTNLKTNENEKAIYFGGSIIIVRRTVM